MCEFSDAGSRTRLYPVLTLMKAGDASRYTTSDVANLMVNFRMYKYMYQQKAYVLA
jgi:hypothetical protein